MVEGSKNLFSELPFRLGSTGAFAFIKDEAKNYNEAFDYCEEHGAHLAIMDVASKNAAIKERLKSYDIGNNDGNSL